MVHLCAMGSYFTLMLVGVSGVVPKEYSWVVFLIIPVVMMLDGIAVAILKLAEKNEA